MSAKTRSKMIWSIPVVALASTLALFFGSRLAASGLPTPPPAIATVILPATLAAASSGAEIGDPSLRALIGRFADSARAQNGRGAGAP
jgi:hypothetical protein